MTLQSQRFPQQQTLALRTDVSVQTCLFTLHYNDWADARIRSNDQ